MNKHKNIKKTIFIDEFGTFDLSENQKRLLNELIDKNKNKKTIIFTPRVSGKNTLWKLLSKYKKMK